MEKILRSMCGISVLKCSVSSSVEVSELEAGSDTILKVPIVELNTGLDGEKSTVNG